jgi:hypothetical protein
MDFYAEAFNVVNHEEVAGVSAIAYQYQNPVAGTTCPTGTYAAPCIVPYTSTKFGTPTATTGTLFGARQLQFIAKLHF